MSFLDRIEYREEAEANGIKGWWWPKGDNGAWQGPKSDWENHHKVRMFNYVKELDTVITAGGNCGMYTRFYADIFKHVYTFEPDAINFHCLVLNNPFENVIKYNTALGDHTGFISVLRAGDDNVGMHKVVEDPEAYIPIMTVDSMALRACNLIQLDVEGYEINVLKGAVETIKRYRPCIVGENCGEHSEVHQFLTAIGYRSINQVAADTVYVHESF